MNRLKPQKVIINLVIYIIFIHEDLFAKLFANTVFLIRNVFVVLAKKTLGRLRKKAFCENKLSPVIAYNLKHKKKSKIKSKIKMGTFVQTV